MKNLLLLLSLVALSASLPAILFYHDSPQTFVPGTDVNLSFEILDGFDAIAKIDLCLLAFDRPVVRKTMEEPMPGCQVFSALLSPQELQAAPYQYWFEIEFTDASIFLYPDEQRGEFYFTLSAEEQLETVVPGPDEPDAAGFVLLSTNDAFAQQGEYVLAVSYFALAECVDPLTIQVWVNGRDVTSKSVITETLLSYRDPKPRTDRYEAVITALDREGRPLRSATFTTPVDPTSGKARLETWGGVNFASNFHSYQPPEEYAYNQPEDPKNNYAGWLDLYAHYKQLKMNLNVLHSSFEDSLRQSVDRYRVGLELGFLSLQAGDHVPQLSPLAMSNKSIRGLYGSLKGKYIGLELTGGEMVRKTVAGDDPDLVTAFRQQALGGKLRLGSEQGLSMSLTLARNRDLIDSLDPADFIWYDPDTADTLFVVAPQDNLVASFATRVNLPGLNTDLGVEVAGSLYNRNTWPGPITAEEIGQYVGGFDYIDPADLADVFVINRNMEPILPGLPNCAARGYLRSNILNNIISVEAAATGPVYHALSTWGQKPDTKTLTVSDMFNLGRFLFLSGAYSWQQDNLFGTARDTNTYHNWHLQGTLRFLKHFSLRGAWFQSAAANAANPAVGEGIDFLPYRRNSHAYTLGAGFNNPRVNYLPWLCELSYRNGTDFRETIDLADYRNSNNSVNLSLVSKFGKTPLRLQLYASLAGIKRALPDYDPATACNGPSDHPRLSYSLSNSLSYQARLSYSLFEDKLIPWLQYRRSDYDEANTGARSNDHLALGLDTWPWKNLSVNTSLNLITSLVKDDSGQNSQTLTWSLTLGQRF